MKFCQHQGAHTTGISLPSLSFNNGGKEALEAEVEVEDVIFLESAYAVFNLQRDLVFASMDVKG